MADLYFMNRKFEGLCFELDEPMENYSFEHIFYDAWYWMHYRFFNCRDSLLSEESDTVTTHLGNLVALLYRSFENITSQLDFDEDKLKKIIKELKEIIEYAKEHPICLWIYGDETSQEWLKEKIDALPANEQISRLLELPHMNQHRIERLSYRFVAEGDITSKRIKREEANFNKRMKIAQKNQQRNG